MHKLITFSAASTLFALTALPASAQTAPAVNKTWVSNTGSDIGSCQLVAPCKTFAYAISETNAGGEIDVKDSGAYGAFTISKSISIIADGVVASVGIGTDNHGIDIATGANDAVLLRGLTVNIHNTSIDFASDIFDTGLGPVVLDRMILEGADIAISQSGNGSLVITNSVISNNIYGIYNISSSGQMYIGYNVVSNNVFALHGRINSYGTNTVIGNISCDTCVATITRLSAD